MEPLVSFHIVVQLWTHVQQADIEASHCKLLHTSYSVLFFYTISLNTK